MPNTTVNALPYPAYGTGADGPAAFQALADAVAPKLYRAEPLTAAQITAITSPRIGQLAFNTDIGRVLFWSGGTWRPVGGGASGRVSIPSISLNATPQTLSSFIGLGFDEVRFAVDAAPPGVSTTVGLVGWAVADPARAILTGSQGSISPYIVRSPCSSSDVIQVTIGSVTVNVSNVRLTVDGYLNLDISNVSGSTTVTTWKMNWRAR